MVVAVYGGSFNSPHIGHALVVQWLQWLLWAGKADEVLRVHMDQEAVIQLVEQIVPFPWPRDCSSRSSSSSSPSGFRGRS